jgi:hypothetical protein
MAPDRRTSVSADDVLNAPRLPRFELEQRIAIVRDNIRSNRPLHSRAPRMKIATRTGSRKQTEELDRLIKQRDALPEK